VSDSDRDHDIVVWGATGVAGRLLAEYLAEQYPPGELALALGGRSEERLGSVEADIRETTDWEEVPVVLGDATDPESLRELAGATDVVATTVGPYTNYGSPLVEACIETGTDYCDLTGEINWIRAVVDEYHDDAVAAETRIVNSCGFDSVPADMGCLLVQSYAMEEHGVPCEEVRIYVDDASGGVSGGTLASFAELFEAASEDPVARETLRNPYSLAPVRRSNALLDYRYGRDFRCSEVIPTGRSLGGAASAGLVAGGIGLFTGAMSVSPLRSLLSDVVFPDPGEGPSERQMENGHFLVSVLGRGAGEDGEFTVEAEFGVDLDPGYGATARMLGESAMCLLRDEVDSPLDGGVLTPASGIGMPLVERLRDVGFTATVGEPTE
jgi:short subunit dehydrogenase-like uncharacterized protein